MWVNVRILNVFTNMVYYLCTYNIGQANHIILNRRVYKAVNRGENQMPVVSNITTLQLDFIII